MGMENYTWKLDKNDDPMDEPVTEMDDAVDADRYGIMAVHGGKHYEFRVRPPDAADCRPWLSQTSTGATCPPGQARS